MGGLIAKIAFMPPDQAASRAYLSRVPGVQFVDSSDGTRISYMHFTHDRRSQWPPLPYTVLYCHGNAEDLAHGHGSYKQLAEKLGVDVFAPDYPGYGASDGAPSEAGAFAAAEAMMQLLLVKHQIPRDKIVIMGRSLGSGVATELASRHRGLAGLILVSPLRSCAAVAGSAAYYLLYPADIMTNIRKISDVRDYPVHIFHGDQDTVVPYAHGVVLFEEIQKVNPQSFMTPLRGCGHNDIEQLLPTQFFTGIRQFIEQTQTRVDALKQLRQQQRDGEGASPSSSSCSSSFSKK